MVETRMHQCIEYLIYGTEIAHIMERVMVCIVHVFMCLYDHYCLNICLCLHLCLPWLSIGVCVLLLHLCVYVT